MRKFTLGLNAAKTTDYTEKYFKQKLRRIEFPTKKKKLVNTCLISPRNRLGGSKNLLFLKYEVLKWEKNFYINPENSSSNSVG